MEIDMSWTDSNGVNYEDAYTVARTETGPICGGCGHHHVDVASVKACYVLAEMHHADMESERRADMANERYFEDRGYDEARLQDEMEARAGVIPFDVARALAEGDMDLADYLMPAPLAC